MIVNLPLHSSHQQPFDLKITLWICNFVPNAKRTYAAAYLRIFSLTFEIFFGLLIAFEPDCVPHFRMIIFSNNF